MTEERPAVQPAPVPVAPDATADALTRLGGGLVVSCQALHGEALHGADIMARMARAAVDGGAVGVRVNTPVDVAAVRAAVGVPVIGLWKDGERGVYITPTLDHARRIAASGADIVALDATDRPRPDGRSLADTIRALRAEGIVVLADVATVEQGIAAARAGAAAVATTLSGYTDDVPGDGACGAPGPGPDFALLAALVARLDVPVVAEGRISTPEQAAHALALGAHTVVVGGAITRPASITERFVAALPSSPSAHRTAREEFPA
ncbi:N-acetylmannosamine-6-phosphate 2-epimerase [Streptomyces sp. VRA16 Mangrove soil]|uniref:N-acetylmannosamine-6-phosphate 2-epimerase n=1 Tax=Streptomyces sp. VRA16 Mangrove soil TaxID=2817434 RepID=UPI001A9FBFC6|nr:putative N-acetylmannosamine-6-phosphate 2-epimerase [Streptomyces sp. VRA16 Mangrove soil]MBO1332303.1 putative N-acetylmannosamine-6-phosphate 2-epimerase [Streptomyces sp. VRA16 Mangrove soil]